MMADGFDQMGKTNMMRVNRLKRREYEEEKLNGREEPEVKEAKMDEYTHII
jgi:hypothetical protein